MQMKYLLDEHVHPDLQSAIHAFDPELEVRRIGDREGPPLVTLDPDLLVWCDAEGFTLITNNRSSMPVHLRDHLAANGHVPGILLLNASLSMGETAELLAAVPHTMRPEELNDLIRWLPV